VLLCPFTTTLLDAPIYRLPINASQQNGLKADSQLMVDKIGLGRRDRVDAVIGQLTDDEMARLTEAMAVMFGVGR